MKLSKEMRDKSLPFIDWLKYACFRMYCWRISCIRNATVDEDKEEY